MFFFTVVCRDILFRKHDHDKTIYLSFNDSSIKTVYTMNPVPELMVNWKKNILNIIINHPLWLKNINPKIIDGYFNQDFKNLIILGACEYDYCHTEFKIAIDSNTINTLNTKNYWELVVMPSSSYKSKK